MQEREVVKHGKIHTRLSFWIITWQGTEARKKNRKEKPDKIQMQKNMSYKNKIFNFVSKIVSKDSFIYFQRISCSKGR